MNNSIILTLSLTLSIGCLPTEQKVRPEKVVFEDADSWPQTAPGSIKLKNFKPFRGVYQRAYSQGSGPNAGELRIDRVIVHAEEVGWDGHAAIHIALIDAADAKWDDTAARNLFMIIDREDMRRYFESGPIPGKAKDYYFARPSTGMGTMVMTGDGTTQNQSIPEGIIGWGPGPWAMASTDLRTGAKIHLGPFASPAANIFGNRRGIVKGRLKFQDLGGESHDTWLIETGGNLSNSRMSQILIVPEPPYFIASFSRDLDSGEESKGTRLLSFQLLN